MGNLAAALHAELASIVGLEGKVYPLSATEGTKPPYIAYSAPEGKQERSLDAFLSLRQSSCELNVVAVTHKALRDLTPSVMAMVQSFEGRSIGMDGPMIQEVEYEEPVELYEPAVNWYRLAWSVRFYY